jgi:hypothetical protein
MTEVTPSSSEVGGIIRIWGKGSWDPTAISGSEDHVDDEGVWGDVAAGENHA